jgi:hypothetical protein
MQSYVEIVTAYFEKYPIDLMKEYHWPRKVPVGFDQTFKNRMELSKTFNSKSQMRQLLATQMVGEWGGIRRGLETVKNEMATETPEQLIKRGVARVSSWSKVIVLHNPETYLIYDARVAWAINLILCKSEEITEFFPMPLSRNSHLNKATKSSVGIKLRSGESKIIQRQHFYNAYLFLAGAVGKNLRIPAWQAEMALFARGPELAKEAVQS